MSLRCIYGLTCVPTLHGFPSTDIRREHSHPELSIRLALTIQIDLERIQQLLQFLPDKRDVTTSKRSSTCT